MPTTATGLNTRAPKQVNPHICMYLTGPQPKEINVETFRINYLIRSPRVEKLGFKPVRHRERERESEEREPERERERDRENHSI